MLDILIIVFAVLFLYQNAQSLMQIPLRDWELVHYALALVSLGLLAVAIWKSVQMYKNHKKRQEEEAEGAEGKEDADAEDSDEEEAPKKYTYEDDDAELAYLDEMDAEEQARKAKQDGAEKADNEDDNEK